MHFQIWIPRAQGQSVAILKKLGLEEFYENAEFTELNSPQTPNGESGSMVSWNNGRANSGYHSESQQWIQVVRPEEAAEKEFWIGFWNDSPPTPSDLLKANHQRGFTIRLNDGNDWLFPLITGLESSCIYRGGAWEFITKDRFANFVETFNELIGYIDGEKSEVPYDLLIELASIGLAINYRVTPEIISHLELFTNNNLSEIAKTLVQKEASCPVKV